MKKYLLSTLVLMMSISFGWAQTQRVTPLIGYNASQFLNGTSLPSDFKLLENSGNFVSAQGKTAGNYQVNPSLFSNVARGGECLTWLNPSSSTGWIDFNNNFGGAPCDDVSGLCPFNEITDFQVWAAEAYSVNNFIIGNTYTFSMCNGSGAGSWVPDFTIIAPSGAVDAFGLGDGDGCSITWTATESGTYLIVINESGFCGGGSNTQTDNGFPALTCVSGSSPCAPPEPCEVGTLVNSDSVAVCFGLTATVTSNGDELIPSGGQYRLQFLTGTDGTGANSTGPGTGFTINTGPDYTFDAGLNGILAANSFPDMLGTWIITAYVTDLNGDPCSISATTKIVNWLIEGDLSCNPPEPCEAGTLVSTDSISICPIETVTVASNGDEILPTGGYYDFVFIPGADGTGGLNAAFTIGAPNPFTFDASLNGVLPTALLEDLRGTWYIRGLVFDSLGVFCSFSTDFLIVNFLDSLDSECLVIIDVCTPPFDLAIDNITSNSADFSWTGTGNEVSFDVELVDITALQVPTGTPTATTEGGANTIVFTGLEFDNRYDAYVRGNCEQIDLILTGVFDGPLTGGVPKGIELYVVHDIADLSIYGISSANNGGGATGAPEFMLSGSASAGTYLYVASTLPDFIAFFGIEPNFVNAAVSINGDDAIELFLNGEVVDVFGEVATDGTGQPWEYLDGWAYRVDNTGTDGSTFVLANWTFSGINNLEGGTTNATTISPFPIGTFTSTLRLASEWVGPISFTTAAAAPVNDNCEGAIAVVCDDVITGSTVDATAEASLGTCGTLLTSAPGVWYSYAGNGDEVTFSLCGSDYDTKIAVFSGSCGLVGAALFCETGNDDACGLQSETSVVTVIGTDYYIYVTGFGSDVGNYTLTVTCETPVTGPVNDSCNGAIALACDDIITGSTADATAETLSFCGTSLSSAPGVWYSFAGTGDEVTFSLCGSGFDTKIGVFSGSCDALVCIGGNDDACGLQSETTVVTEIGTDYYIYVTGFNSNVGDFTLTVTCATIALAPTANFTGIPTTICLGDDVEFTDASTDGPTSWEWDFGDGNVSTAQNPSHVYAASGTYTVQLIASNGAGSDTLILTDYIVVQDPPVGFGATATSTTINEGESTTLQMTGTFGGAYTWYDDLNNVISNNMNFEVSPTATTTYTATCSNGICVVSANVTITVIPAIEVPANDTCGGAIAVTCSTNIDVAAGDATATSNPTSCAGSVGPGLWYTFTGDGQEWEITATPNNWDPEIQILSGSCGNFVCETNSDNTAFAQSETASLLTVIGTEYYVFIGTWASFDLEIDSFNLAITCVPPVTGPVNDSCNGAIAVVCDDVITGSTIDATADATLGTCGTSLTSAPGVWYSFAGTGDEVTFSLCGSGFDTKIGVFSGSCDALVCIGGNDDACGLQSETSVATEIGTDYYVYVTGFGTDAGDFTLSVTCVPPGGPCVDYLNPTTVPGWQDFNNIYGGAPCDDGTGCPFNEITAFEVWASEAYEVIDFIAGGEYTFSMCNGAGAGSWIPEFTIVAPSGAIDAFGAGDGDGCSISWTASESGTYLIIINEAGFCGGGSNTATNNGFPALTCTSGGLAACEPVVGPVNDTCSGAIAVVCDDVITGSTVDATADATLGTCGTSLTSAPGVWYSFAGTDDEVTFSLCGSGFDTKIGVFSGSCDALVCIGGNDDACGLQSETTVVTEIGTDYYIYVTGFGSDVGDFTLTVTCGPPVPGPINDTCGGALTLVIGAEGTCNGGSGFLSTSTSDATQTLIKTCDGSLSGDPDLYYTFTATSEAINFNSITGLPGIEVFDGNCGALGNSVGCLNNTSGSIEGLTIGNQYYAVIWTDGPQSVVEFCIDAVTLDLCDAGTLTSADSFAICPDSTVTLTVANDSLIPTGGQYGIYFALGPDGGGALGGDFILLDVPAPFTFDYTLNQILPDNGFPNFTGTWYVYGAVYRDPANPFSTICDFTNDYMVVTFLEPGSADCAPIVVPVNDSCSGAIAVLCDDIIEGSTTTATADASLGTCGTSLTSAPGVWYSFAGTGDEVTFSLCGSGFDTKIGVFSGSCDALVCEGGNDDACGLQSETSVVTEIGTDYYVYVTGFGTDAGDFTLTVTCATPEPCDAGTLTSIDSVAICQDSTVTITVANDSLIPTGGQYGIYFELGPDGGGALGGDFILTGVDAPYTFDYTLNQILPNNGFPNFTGTWYVYGAVYSDPIDPFNTICDFTNDYLVVTFLEPGDGACAPIVAPVNDSCNGAIAVVCDDVITGSTTDATADASVGTCGTILTSAPGVWYSFAGTGDDVTFSLCGSGFDTKIGVFSGSCDALVCIGGNDDACGLQSEALVTTQIGTDYYVFVTGFGSATGDFTLSVTCVPPGGPCVDYLNPTSVPGWQDFNNIYGGAPCDDGTGCPFNEITVFEVWASEAYEVIDFIAGGEYTFSMCNGPGAGSWVPEFTIVAPSGAIDAFGAGDGDGCSISWTASESGTYLIIINEAGFCPGGANTATDNGFPALTCTSGGLAACEPVVGPVNDTCSGAIAVVCDDVITGSTVDATADATLGTCGTSLTSAPGVWYSFAGTDDEVTFSLCGSGFDTKIGVFSGSCDALVCIGGNDDACGLQSETTVVTEIGTDYYIYVTGFGSDVGDFTLTVTCGPPVPGPINDTCGGALTLVIGAEGTCNGGSGFLSTSTSDATQTLIKTCDGSLSGDPDLYYTFTATSEAINFNSITGLPGIEVFDGNCGALGNSVGCLNNTSGSIEGLTIGNQYYAVIWTDGPQSVVEFCIDAVTLDLCDAGTITSADSFAICPDSTVTLTVANDSIVPTGGQYGMYFALGPDGGGALGGDFILLDVQAPFTFDYTLNQILPDNGFPNFTGTWYVYGAVYRDPTDPFNTICDFTNDYMVVTFLEPGSADCAPIVVPVNDSCSGAIAVLCDDIIEGSTTTATADASLGTCGTSLTSAPGVWYSFAGTGDEVTFSLCGSGFDTKIGLFSGSCDALVCEGGNDDACGLQSEASVTTQIGTDYYVFVTGFGSATGDFTLSVTCVPPGGPCVDYLNPTSVPGWQDFNNIYGGAPCDDGTGCPFNEITVFEVWASEAYEVIDFIAGGEYTFSMCNGPGAGSWVPEFTIVAPSGAIDAFGAGDGDGCSISWTASESGTYLIIINEAGFCPGGANTATDNGFPALTCTSGGLAACEPVVGPVNDTCSGAIAVVCDDVITGSTVDATADATLGTCGTSLTSAPGVWYSFEGTGDDVTFSLCGSGFDTKIGVFTGSCDALVCIGGNDDVCGLQSETSVVTEIGTDYYVFVTGFGSDAGDFTLTVTCEPAVPGPVNDLCSGAIEVECDDVITGSTIDANAENLSFCGTSLSSAPGVWYSFVGTGDEVTFSLCGSDYDTKIGVFSGSCSALVCERGNDDACGLQSETSVVTEIGTDYYVYVTGFNTATGNFILSVTCAAPEPCDAGTLTSIDSFAICRDSIVTITVANDSIIPTGGQYGIYFVPGPDGGGALGGEFILLNVQAPFTFDYTLNQILPNNGFPNFTGTWYVYGAVYNDPTDPFNTICDFTNDYMVVTFLEPGSGDCAPIVVPVNDSCSGAIAVLCDDIIEGSTTTATTENLSFCGTSLNTAPGVWYSFAGTGDNVTFSLCGSGFDTKIGVFSGSCDALVCEGGNDDACGLQSETSVVTEIGTDYYIYVTGFNTAIGDFTLSVTCSVPEPCEAGTLTSVDSFAICQDSTVTITVANDSLIPTGGQYGIYFAPGPDGGGALGGEFILLNVQAPYTFDYTLNQILPDNGFPNFTGTWYVYGAVYSDPSDPFNTICDQTNDYMVVTFLEPGVDGCSEGPPVPINDTCGGAISVTCGSVVTGSTVDATTDLSTFFCGTPLNTAPGIWYTFTGTGEQVTFSTCGSGFDTKIGVFTGSCDGLICEDGNDDACGLQSEVDVLSTLGTTYYILVTGFGIAEGDFTLSVTCSEPVLPPVNDTCGGAIVISCPNGFNGTVDATGATAVDAPVCDGTSSTGAGVWYTYVGDGNLLDIFVDPYGFDAEIQIHSGSCGNLSCELFADDGFFVGDPEEVTDFETIEGVTYYIYVGSWISSITEIDSFDISISCNIPPTCTAPTELEVSNLTETSATLSWTPGGSETIWNIEIVNVTAGGVFTGVPTANGITDTFFDVFNLIPGNEYAFYVISDCQFALSEWAGPLTFTTLTVAPVNDLCSGAIAVECDDVISGSTENATAESLSFCGTSLSSAPGVWYSYEGNGDDVTFSLCGSDYDTKIAVFTGICGELTCVDGNDDSNECGSFSLESQIEVTTVIGTDYYVYVTGFSTEAGDFVLSVTCETPIPVPVNDTCGGAIAVLCDDIVTGSTVDATADNLDFCNTSLSSAPGVWYTFAGTGDDVTFSLCGSDFDTKMGVFSGTCDDLTCVSGNDDSEGCGDFSLQSEVEVATEIGTDYYVFVTGFSSSVGEFTLSVTCVEPSCDTPLITVDLITDVACGGESTGAIDVSVSGGSGSYTYLWSNGAETEDLEDVAAGEYTLTVTDGVGCPATVTVVIEENEALTEPVPAVILTNGCDGSGTGASIDITISGGVEPYSYLWSNGATTQDLVNVGGDDYTLVVTDANNCTYTTQTFAISDEGSIFELVEAVVTNVSCHGDNTGAIDITLAGGVPPYIIRWSNNLHTEDISGLVAGEYVFFATDQTGCEYLSQVIVVEEPDLITESVSAVISNTECNGGSTGSIDISIAGGTPPYSYLWSNGSTNEDPTDFAAGIYQVTVTDANECTFLSSLYLIEEPSAIVTSHIKIIDAECNGTPTGGINIDVSGGTPDYIFLWSNGSTNEDLSGVVAGEYSVDISDANGCTITAGPYTIGEPSIIMISSLSVEDADCNGTSTGSINIFVSGGTAPYTYSWSNGATTQDLSNIPAGDYVGTITDNNNCVLVSGTITVGEPDVISVTSVNITNANCNGEPSGGIDIEVAGGTPPYTYLWSDGSTTQDLNDVVAGTYVGIITDSKGCTLESPALEIGEPTAIEITSLNITNVGCNGDNTGAIDIEVAGGVGPYTYNWSNGASTQDIANLEEGDYIGTITDFNGCTLTATVTVLEPTAIFVALPAAVTDVTCNGDEDGAIDITIQGGTLPYGFVWSNGSTDEDIADLEPGNYSYVVTDGNGCVFTSSTIVVGEPDLLAVNGVAEDVACFGESSGTVTSEVTGGTEPYSYVWSNGATTSTISEVTAGDYSLQVTDANGCTITSESFTVNQPSSELSGSVTTTDASGNGIPDGSATANATGGDEPYSYIWQGGFGNTQLIDELINGIYCVDITDANGCKFTACGTVGFPTAIVNNLQISEITLYPNPTTNYTNLNVQLTKAANVALEIVDVLGKEYQSQLLLDVEEANVIFDLRDFAGGTYFIRITVDKEIISLPIVVQH